MATDEKAAKVDDAISNMNEAIEYLETPVKANYDDNEYRALKLSNGLKVVLVSNPSASEEEENYAATGNEKYRLAKGRLGRDKRNRIHMLPSQASFKMNIDVGNFSDPPEVPYVSQILANIILTASQNYPEQKGLFLLATRNHGAISISANTSEKTAFYVHLSESHFVEAIKRFVDCFVNPLLRMNDVEEQMESILLLDDIRHRPSMVGDEAPLNYGRQYLFDAIASKIPGHPGCNFEPGYHNKLKSLSKERIYEEVERFMKHHYSAHRMCVVIEGRLPLDTLESYAKTYFSKIPNNNLPRADYTRFDFDQIFNTPIFRMMYQLNADYTHAEGSYALELHWPVRSWRDLYKTKPQHYISWMMIYGGKNSLTRYLTSKGWCHQIRSGIDCDRYKGISVFNLFTVTIILTEEGFENFKQVLDALFSYINMMRREGPQERVYDEVRRMEEAKLRFELLNVYNTSLAPLAEVMATASPADYLTGDTLLLEYSSEEIKECFDLMAPEKANIILFDSNFYAKKPVFDDWEEGIDDLPHCRRKMIPEEWIEEWKNIEPLEEFDFPEVNMYVSDDSELKSKPEIVDQPENPPPNEPQNPVKNRLLIHTGSYSRVWYERNTKFPTRENFVRYLYRNPLPSKSSENAFMSDLLVQLFRDLTTDDLFASTVVGFSYSLLSEFNGIWIFVSGKGRKVLLLTQEIARLFRNFQILRNVVTEEVFETTKQALVDKYRSELAPTFDLVLDAGGMLLSNHLTKIEKLKASANVDYTMFEAFAMHFAEHVYIECLAQGSVGKAEVISNVENCCQILGCRNPTPNMTSRAMYIIPRGTRIARFRTLDPESDKKLTMNYYQLDDYSFPNYVMIEFLVFCLTCVFVLSPIDGVFTSDSANFGYYITGPSCQGIDNFRSAARRLVLVQTRKQWRDLQKLYIEKCRVKAATSLQMSVERNWLAIALDHLIFDKAERQLETFMSFEIDDLREGLVSLLEDPSSRKLSVQAVGNWKCKCQLIKEAYERAAKREAEAAGDEFYEDSDDSSVYSEYSEEYSEQDENPKCVCIRPFPENLQLLANLPEAPNNPLHYYILDVAKFKSEAQIRPFLEFGSLDDFGDEIAHGSQD